MYQSEEKLNVRWMLLPLNCSVHHLRSIKIKKSYFPERSVDREMMSKTQYSNEMHSTEVSMNVMSDRKRLQSNVKNVYTCLLIGFQNLRKKRNLTKRTFVAVNALCVKLMIWQFSSGRCRCVWHLQTMNSKQFYGYLCCIANEIKWMVIFVICVFVQCVLIKLDNRNHMCFS